MELIVLEEIDQPLVDLPAETVLILHLVAGVLGKAEDEEKLVEGHLVLKERQTHLVILLYYFTRKVPLLVGMLLDVRISYAFCK